MKKTLYLIPVAYASNGTLPTEYHIIEETADRRRTFAKRHEGDKLNYTRLIRAIAESGASVKTNYKNGSPSQTMRIIMPNGEAAVIFRRRYKKR